MEMVSTSSKRIDKYDNLKGFAIILVLLGHFDVLRVITPIGFKIIFLIDLPLFFFVSGYFSKIGPDEPIKSFKRLFLPYIIFCILYKLFDIFILDIGHWTELFIYPGFAMWFLIALFFMKMALPIFDRLKYPIIISLICALFFGFLNVKPELLGLTRAFSYFPIFLLGFYYNKYRDILTDAYPKIADFCKNHFKVILIALIIISVFVIATIPEKFFYLKNPYTGNLLYEMIEKGIVILLAMAWVVVFNHLMIDKPCFLTKFGVNSMAVYLFHGFIRQYFKPIFKDVFANNKPEFFVFLIVFTFIVTYVLSRDIVSEYLNKFIDAIYNLIVRSVTILL